MNDIPPDFSPTIEDYRWLLAHAETEYEADFPQDLMQCVSYFRKRHSVNRSKLLVELLDLRQRGLAKFRHAEKLFFTKLGLEQATDERIATHKANRFANRTQVVDLCCGIGGDLMSLAGVCQVTAVDSNPCVVAIAEANVGVSRRGANVRFCCDDIRHVDLSSFDAWHVDPDRRKNKSRQSNPAFCEPPLAEFELHLRSGASGAIKLSPAADTSEFIHKDIELEWIGHNRQCQQLVLWSGTLARFPGKRVATWLWNDALGLEHTSQLVEEDVGQVPMTDSLPTFLHEPQPSVLAAGLEDVLAAKHGLYRIVPRIPYFVSDTACHAERLLSTFEILDNVPLRKSVVQRRIRELDMSVIEVKKRGINVDPNKLHAELPRSGGSPVSVILTMVGDSRRALLTRRVAHS